METAVYRIVQEALDERCPPRENHQSHSAALGRESVLGVQIEDPAWDSTCNPC